MKSYKEANQHYEPQIKYNKYIVKFLQYHSFTN
jgi:hypothetical protein